MEYIEILDEAPFSPGVIKPLQNELVSSSKAFIESNTVECALSEIQKLHSIPVWTKDNELLISHADFIGAAQEMTSDVFHGEQILKPVIRVSHPIKGRVPSAKDKPANMLADHERTLFYERMMFCIEVPSIQAEVDGNLLSLVIGGVKSYGEDNLYQRNGGDQHFKVFAGLKNRVCTNLCVWSDGYVGNLLVKNLSDLYVAIKMLLVRYNAGHHLHHMQQLSKYSITEQQFAHLIGRCRMYQHLPANLKAEIPQILFGENQMGAVVRDFYRDKSFCRQLDGSINLWKLFNLFTGANKSSYIDSYLDRSVNAYNFVEQIRWALDSKQENWYLN